MVDPERLAALGVAADLVLRALGPTADYIGNELPRWAELRRSNLQRTFEHAERKLGTEGLERSGRVSPRVLKEVLDGALYWDDSLAVEYFGGILAASKSEFHRDDRGATFASLVGQLSTYQVRAHYLAYAHARNLLVGRDFDLGVEDIRTDLRVYVPASSWEEGMAFSLAEADEFEDHIGHFSAGLFHGHGLIDKSFGGGRDPDLLSHYFEGRDFPDGGVVFMPSTRAA